MRAYIKLIARGGVREHFSTYAEQQAPNCQAASDSSKRSHLR